MSFPTIPEMEDRAECFLFGHDWPCPTIRALESVPPPSA